MIRDIRHCLERYDSPKVFSKRGRIFEWFSVSHECSDSLKETRACASIEHVFTSPMKPSYTILLPIYVNTEGDEEDRLMHRGCAKATYTSCKPAAEGQSYRIVCKARAIANYSSKNCQVLTAEANKTKAKPSSLTVALEYKPIDHRNP